MRMAQPRSFGRAIAEGWLDPVPESVPAPPAACGALARAGWEGVIIRMEHTDSMEDLSEVLFDLCDQPDAPHAIHGDGFSIEPLIIPSRDAHLLAT